MTGDHDVNDLIHKKKDLIELLDKGGFALHKWASNNQKVIEAADETNENTSLLIQNDDTVKTLGLLWNTRDDHFQFKVNPIQKPSKTKREILSEISTIFDPLGLIGPVIVMAKCIMRLLWKSKLNWDDQAPDDILMIWFEFQNTLPQLNDCRIKRWLHYNPNIDFELHGFADASETAYGAVLYLRSIDETGIVHVDVICSKSRIAPIKSVTIPRLELCGTLLVAQLVTKTLKAMRIVPKKVQLWSDSTIALSWIATDVALLKQFVGNRVEVIQQQTQEYQWHYVNGKCNPADLVSRGTLPNKLINEELWWHGPKWLLDNKPFVQEQPIDSSEECQKEFKSTTSLVSLTTECNIIHHFSTVTRTIKMVAIWKRYFSNLRAIVVAKKANDPNPKLMKFDVHPLNSSELDEALITCIKLVQLESFTKEIIDLRDEGIVNKSKSRLAPLLPFLDDRGLIRVRGRLEHSLLSYDQKHPIVIPYGHPFVTALARREHLQHLHAGPKLLLSILRRRFWPLRGSRLCSNVVNNCVQCFRANPKPIVQQIGQLPAARVQPIRPFIKVGVDYAGPILVKSGLTKKAIYVKAYIALFVCMATKALHLELVHSLTTDAFLAALRRFVSRRGKCREIFSDNGRNFVGANREMSEFFEWLSETSTQQCITSSLISQGTEWHFNPPYSPHRGGLWEAGVKSVKSHLARSIGSIRLTFEEMTTLLCEIEAVLNSRPLVPITDNLDDIRALTPGDFLIGNPLTEPVDSGYVDFPISVKSRYKLIQEIKNQFWLQWQRDYLPSLQLTRNDWRDKPVKVNVGDLVIVQMDNQPVGQWPLGRICKLKPGKDGITRTVDIKLPTKIITRAVQRICLLPFDEDYSSPHGPRC